VAPMTDLDNAEPVRVVLYGDNVATVDGALSMLASGASALRRREVGLRRRDALSEPLG
jgi:hypothetical protein